MKRTKLLKSLMSVGVILAISPLFYSSQSWSWTGTNDRKISQPAPAPGGPDQQAQQKINSLIAAMNAIQAASVQSGGPAVEAVDQNGTNVENFKNNMIAKLAFLTNAAQQNHAQNNVQEQLNRVVTSLNTFRAGVQNIPGPALNELLQNGTNIDAFTQKLVEKITSLRDQAANSELQAQNQINRIVQALNTARNQFQAMPGPVIDTLLPRGENIDAFINTLILKVRFLVNQTPQNMQAIIDRLNIVCDYTGEIGSPKARKVNAQGTNIVEVLNDVQRTIEYLYKIAVEDEVLGKAQVALLQIISPNPMAAYPYRNDPRKGRDELDTFVIGIAKTIGYLRTDIYKNLTVGQELPLANITRKLKLGLYNIIVEANKGHPESLSDGRKIINIINQGGNNIIKEDIANIRAVPNDLN